VTWKHYQQATGFWFTDDIPASSKRLSTAMAKYAIKSDSVYRWSLATTPDTLAVASFRRTRSKQMMTRFEENAVFVVIVAAIVFATVRAIVSASNLI